MLRNCVNSQNIDNIAKKTNWKIFKKIWKNFQKSAVISKI